MNFRALLFAPPILIGVGIFVWMNQSGNEREKVSPPETAQAVRILDVTRQDYRPSISGYGRLQAVQSWSAISQVEGRAEFLDPSVAIGEVVESDRKLIGIDPRNYEIALDRAKASRDSAQASLDELSTTEANNLATLKLEKEIETILKADLERQIKLKERGTVAQSGVDTARRALIAQQRVVLGIENTLRLLPTQKATLEATLATRQVEIEEAERLLDNTIINAPFTGLVTEKAISQGQYARTGNSLLTIEDISASEVVAEFQPRLLGSLIRLVADQELRDLLSLQDNNKILDQILSLKLTASVTLPDMEQTAQWPVTISRFNGTADSSTGAVGVVVHLKDPYRPNVEQRRPPLSNGTFVRVELSASEVVEAIRIPQTALHRAEDGSSFVYVMDPDSRLQRKVVQVGPVLDDQIVVRSGLVDGDKLVLSEPVPAVAGALLAPVTQ